MVTETLGKNLRDSFVFRKTKTTCSLSVEVDLSDLVLLQLNGEGQIKNYQKYTTEHYMRR